MQARSAGNILLFLYRGWNYRLTLKRNSYKLSASSVLFCFVLLSLCRSLDTGYGKNKSGRRMPTGIEFKMDFFKLSHYFASQSRHARLRGKESPNDISSLVKRSDASDSVGVPGLCPGHTRLKTQGSLIVGFSYTPITVKPDSSPTGALAALRH